MTMAGKLEGRLEFWGLLSVALPPGWNAVGVNLPFALLPFIVVGIVMGLSSTDSENRGHVFIQQKEGTIDGAALRQVGGEC